MQNNYYVYSHYYLDDLTIFYIGKGTKSRAYSKQRNQVWKSLTESRDYGVTIIQDNLSNRQAIELENNLIKQLNPEANLIKKSVVNKTINYDIISSAVEYSTDSPTFLIWKTDRANGSRKAASKAGSWDSEGYGQVWILDRMYKIHRIIYCLHSGVDLESDLIIDHVDRNKSNNRIENLRLTTISENAKNIDWSKSKPTNTGYRGISLRESSYRVSWTENQKQKERSFSFKSGIKHTGKTYFETKEDAFSAALEFRDFLVSQGLIHLN